MTETRNHKLRLMSRPCHLPQALWEACYKDEGPIACPMDAGALTELQTVLPARVTHKSARAEHRPSQASVPEQSNVEKMFANFVSSAAAQMLGRWPLANTGSDFSRARQLRAATLSSLEDPVPRLALRPPATPQAQPLLLTLQDAPTQRFRSPTCSEASSSHRAGSVASEASWQHAPSFTHDVPFTPPALCTGAAVDPNTLGKLAVEEKAPPVRR